ncbi:3'(2'),5'-bisphosphate nucleotidase [Saccharicrinis carchari]|uniref:3'(2'),5'-bisphosphate nucleotidase CysQ n=1 Tax=Saccharicrinis carchari TaxID=1168039 RepID=A0A521BUK0_SACCC|nr:3'(2'),5'-bisphosphate nucleotidase CysQ [Saccharicrinis carchari]SMO50864.1 3'(2'),5'-bisphosphate nucleotidase [Saccharicrinis carchari]
MDSLLHTAIKASVAAGKAILEVYESENFGVEAKADSSPLTLADRAAHDIIEAYLLKSNIPILSEEGKHEGYDTRKKWEQLWIVDPLDGTREFVKKTGEFTVNIALINNGLPVLGVVFVPVSAVLYYAVKDEGAFKVTLEKDWGSTEDVQFLHSQRLPLCNKNEKFRIVASVSHRSAETNQFIGALEKKFGQAEVVSVGSSIKLCKVAEGSADVYPRMGPTMEWDIAAGQAIAEAAGAHVTDWDTGSRMVYNKASLYNNWFVVSKNELWRDRVLSLARLK